MTVINLNAFKTFTGTLTLALLFTLASCGNNSGDKSGSSAGRTNTDTTHTGLEGTRDQGATLGTETITDTSNGQSAKGGSDSSGKKGSGRK